MSDASDAEYEAWVKIANDPRESEDTRAVYRARMEQFVLQRLRGAFKAARPPASSGDAPRG